MLIAMMILEVSNDNNYNFHTSKDSPPQLGSHEYSLNLKE